MCVLGNSIRLVLVKWWLLAIPHYLILSLFQGGGGQYSRVGWIFILAIFGANAVMFMGKYPEDLFKLVDGLNRWNYRVFAYAALMKDEYPPFRLWDNDME